jgi:hypothetical protein
MFHKKGDSVELSGEDVGWVPPTSPSALMGLKNDCYQAKVLLPAQAFAVLGYW